MKRTLLRNALSLAAMLATSVAMAGYTHFIGMKFVDIPTGSFFMGSCKDSAGLVGEKKRRAFMNEAQRGGPCPSVVVSDQEALENETPQHRVHVSAFQMGQTEVTLGQFKRFIADGHEELLNNDFMQNNSHGDDAAVSYVRWEDAQAFVAWLSRNRAAGDDGAYRLPSEAEWEYAARAGSTERYHFGNSAALLGDYAWYDGNAYDRGEAYSHPVAQKKPSAWGGYDMHGNVWEWVEDCWHDNYRGAPDNGAAWTVACSDNVHVLRGGSWNLAPLSLRAANRSNYSPHHHSGFRVVRLISPASR